MDAPTKTLGSTFSRLHTVNRPSRQEAEAAVRTLIAWAGDDPDREGLIETPERVTRAYGELFAGYDQDVAETLSKTFRDVGGYDEIVLVKDIPFHSHCEHHMVPFTGKAHIAYLPNEEVIGLSKLARLVEVFARRLQTQENLTAQIIDSINEHLGPRGAAVMLEAEHMCMTMRGVQKPGAITVTSCMLGCFRTQQKTREEFLTLIKGR